MRGEALSTSREERRRIGRRAVLAACLIAPALVLGWLSVRSILGGAEARRMVLAETYRQVADLVASELSARILQSERYLVDELAAGAPDSEELLRRIADWTRQDARLQPMALVGPGGELLQPLPGQDNSLEALIAARRSDSAPAQSVDAVVIPGFATGDGESRPAATRATPHGATASCCNAAGCTCPSGRTRTDWLLERRLETIACQIDNRQLRLARSSAVGVLRNLVYNRFNLRPGTYEEYYPRINELIAGMKLDAATTGAVAELRREAGRRDEMADLLDSVRRLPELDRRLTQVDIDFLLLAGKPGEALVLSELPGVDARIVHRLGADSLTELLAGILDEDAAWSDAGVALVDDSGTRLDGATSLDTGSEGSGAASQVPTDAARSAMAPIPGWSVAAFPRAGSLEELARGELRDSLVLIGLALVACCVGAALAGRGLHRELSAARMRSDFVSSVSHELKTPLTLLSTSVENLRSGCVSDDERGEYYETMAGEAVRLSDLIDNVLSFRRIESGGRTYRFVLSDLRDLVDEMLCRYRTQLVSRGIALETDYPDEPVLARVDRAGMQQVLVNLLSNAVKHMGDESPTIGVSLRQADGHVSIAISDTGMGIPRQEIAQVFEPFYRGRRSVAAAVAGSGIGLSIVRHIVEAHEGAVGVDSEPGRGATFTVTLPRSPGERSRHDG